LSQASPRPCHHRRLVSSELCHIEQCSRGTIHVRLGELTLHLRVQDFVAIATALRTATNRLDPSEVEPLLATRLLC
jgi:hypothetical protein